MNINKKNSKIVKIDKLIKNEEDKLRMLLYKQYYEKIALEIMNLCEYCINNHKNNETTEPLTKSSSYLNYKSHLLGNITEQSNYLCSDNYLDIQLYYEYSFDKYNLYDKTFPMNCDFEYLNSLLNDDNIKLTCESFTGKSITDPQKTVNKFVVAIKYLQKDLTNNYNIKLTKKRHN